VLVLVALAVAFAHPPAGFVQTAAARVPLAISSWCWGTHCGAPIAASTKAASVARGSTVRVELQFTPTGARVAVAGVRQQAVTRGHEITWRATRSGGMTLRVTSAKGWVIYVGRLKVR
jgi:hypothetical protein